ncbi:hypothetical protein, partial [Haematobacter missouriensis]|uniref:hypothetical protein n=1 Tax=Haematobacter missouriensis TaxID=366616 RepID=UPI0023F000EA
FVGSSVRRFVGSSVRRFVVLDGSMWDDAGFSLPTTGCRALWRRNPFPLGGVAGSFMLSCRPSWRRNECPK